jgi:hypothetical protein
MANDPPTNLRMGFGFTQARASGAPYVRPRSSGEMDWDLKNRQSLRKLNDLVKQHPSLKVLIEKILEAWKAEHSRSPSGVELYYLVLRNRPKLAPSGYWDYVENTYGWEGAPKPK